jgi:phosphodiesterase/alkaline phosphatase D-like protein
VTLAWTNNWSLPAATNGLVQRATNSAFTANVTTVSVSASATTYVDTAVQPNTQYYYRVRAENSNSYSVWSNTAPAKTSTTGVPLAPTNLVIGTPRQESLPITWVNPLGGPLVNSIVVQYSRFGPNGPWTTAATLGAGATSFNITGLSNGRTYWIRVNAVNGAGIASSAVRAGTTLR